MAINSKDILTPAVMQDLQKNINEARADTTPHIGVAGDEIFVVGDANKTEEKIKDYKIITVWDKEKAEKFGITDIIKESNDGTKVAFEMEFKDVKIVPRNKFKINAAVADILPFLTKYDESGNAEDMSTKELTAFSVDLAEDFLDSMYLFVGAVLDVKKEVYSTFDAQSVIEHCSRFIQDFPEIINEPDF